MPKKTNGKANPSPTAIPPVLTGVAGEYFVAAELSRQRLCCVHFLAEYSWDRHPRHQPSRFSFNHHTMQKQTKVAKSIGCSTRRVSDSLPQIITTSSWHSLRRQSVRAFMLSRARPLRSSSRILTSSGFARLAETADNTWIPRFASLWTSRTTT